MKPTKIAIEYLVGKEWVELIELDINEPEKRTYEEIETLVERITNMIYKPEKQLFQSGDGVNALSVSIRNIDKGLNIFRVKTK